MTTNGTILHLQRLSTEDGPGIRTTVFFKGCPLRCAWCHNPESISPRPQVQWLENRCITCYSCLEICPNDCLVFDKHGVVIDRELCQGCGTCARECPGNAMELLGVTTSTEDLLAELVKDKAFFSDGGGVTLSGGEPTLQSAFAIELLAGLQAAGIHTALDTCGLCARPVLERLYPLVDLFLFDLKLIDSERCRQFTGQDNEIVIDNLRWLSRQMAFQADGKKLWIRTPLIPNATTGEQNITAIGALIATHLNGNVERWELCTFNNLCRDKYRRLGMDWEFASTPLLGQPELDQIGAWARASGVDPKIVFITGSTKTATS